MTAPEGVQRALFRVDGFRNPTIPEERRRALEAAEAQPLDMSVAGVLMAAKARTGLDDFGSRDFQERLSRLLAEVEADGRQQTPGERHYHHVGWRIPALQRRQASVERTCFVELSLAKQAHDQSKEHGEVPLGGGEENHKSTDATANVVIL